MSNSQRCGFISLLYSIGDEPLSLWSKHISLDGRIRRVKDNMLNGDKVIEIMGPHNTPVPTGISCPANPLDVLNIKLPILVLIIKNLELMFRLEFQLIDQKKHRRKFSLTTYNHEKLPAANTYVAPIPLKLAEDWNNLEINLHSLCNEIYGTDFQALQRIIIYPNCRIRRLYLQDRHYEHDETPVELCQAFFDMYMLKWGIHLVEQSCQTEEAYTGPLQPCDLEYFTTESKASIVAPSTITKTFDNSHGIHIRRNSKTVGLEYNLKSVNEVDEKMDVPKNQEFEIHNRKPMHSITDHHVKSSTGKDKRKTKSANVNMKDKKKSEHRNKKNKEQGVSKVDTVALCLSKKEQLLKSFPHIEKSQYLKMQISETFSKQKSNDVGYIFRDWPYKYKGSNSGKERVIKRSESKGDRHLEARSSDATKISRLHTNSTHLDPCFIASKHKRMILSQPECIMNSKAQTKLSMTTATRVDSSFSTKYDDNQKTSVDERLPFRSTRAIQDIITEVQRIREELNHHGVSNKKSVARQRKELPHIIPPVVEIQAKPSETKSKKTVLSTDKAVGDFLKLRHIVNEKMLEKLQAKGLTMTEVELSIYNSKNRRNCYGQGKLIESSTISASKGSGLSSVKPLEMDVSMEREQLSLNDRMCVQLRNELDATLLQLKSTHVRVTAKVVQETIGAIINTNSATSRTEFFTAQEAESIKQKIRYTEEMLKRDRVTEPCCKYTKYEDTSIDMIQNSEECNKTKVVNILFERELHEDKTEYINAR